MINETHRNENKLATREPFWFHQAAGVFGILVGGLVIVSWFARWTCVLQILPDAAPMQFNAALCFIWCGTTGLLLLANFILRRERKSRERAEEKLRQSHTELANVSQLQHIILNSANYAIVACDTKGVVTLMNASAERWLGYTAAEVTGKTTPALWHDADEVAARAKSLSQELGRLVAPGMEVFTARPRLGQPDEQEWIFIRKDGSRFTGQLSVTPLLNVAGEITGSLGVIEDLTEKKTLKEVLERRQNELRLLFDYLPALICYKDTQNGIVRANQRMAEPLGKTVAEIEGKSTEEFYPNDAAKYFADDLEVIQSGKPKLGIIETFQDCNNQPVWIETSKVPVRDGSGTIVGLIVMAQEITERRQAEQALRDSKERFKTLAAATFEAICISENGCFVDVNEQFCELFGYEKQEVIGRPLIEFIPPECQAEVAKKIQDSKPTQYELLVRHRDGHSLSVETRVKIFQIGERTVRLSALRDVTESKRTAAKIIDSLQEKEALLREIHHRVKNNLQVITSILNLQSAYIQDPMALEIFQDCQGRIRTMALIHEQLYRSQGLARIDFKDYLESLVSLLLRSQSALGVTVRTELQIERIILDADTAIPLGLIANELISNCLKHAFIGRPVGLVKISLLTLDDGGFALTVQDDGHGLLPGFDLEKNHSLGVRLVNILCGQINGKLAYENNPGAQFTVTFPEPEPEPSVEKKIISAPVKNFTDGGLQQWHRQPAANASVVEPMETLCQ